MRTVTQVQGRRRRCRVTELVETQAHPIGVDATEPEGLFNRLLDEHSRMVLVELEDAHKLAHARPIGPLGPQTTEQPLVGERPGGAPAPDWLSVVERAGAVEQQRQIMQRVEHVLLAVIATRVAGQQRLLVQDIDLEWTPAGR